MLFHRFIVLPPQLSPFGELVLRAYRGHLSFQQHHLSAQANLLFKIGGGKREADVELP